MAPLEAGSKGSGGKTAAAWDQFAANASLFGVGSGAPAGAAGASSFPAELYTSKIDLSRYTPKQLAAAEALAAEIATGGAGAAEGDGSDGGEDADGDEEARFSAVKGKGAAASGPARAAAAAGDSFTDAGVAKAAGKKSGGRR